MAEFATAVSGWFSSCARAAAISPATLSRPPCERADCSSRERSSARFRSVISAISSAVRSSTLRSSDSFKRRSSLSAFFCLRRSRLTVATFIGPWPRGSSILKMSTKNGIISPVLKLHKLRSPIQRRSVRATGQHWFNRRSASPGHTKSTTCKFDTSSIGSIPTSWRPAKLTNCNLPFRSEKATKSGDRSTSATNRCSSASTCFRCKAIATSLAATPSISRSVSCGNPGEDDPATSMDRPSPIAAVATCALPLPSGLGIT
ncbi:hypothetical protein ACVWZL_008564 [Bradyrhizobium sp. GM2.4]